MLPELSHLLARPKTTPVEKGVSRPRYRAIEQGGETLYRHFRHLSQCCCRRAPSVECARRTVSRVALAHRFFSAESHAEPTPAQAAQTVVNTRDGDTGPLSLVRSPRHRSGRCCDSCRADGPGSVDARRGIRERSGRPLRLRLWLSSGPCWRTFSILDSQQLGLRPSSSVTVALRSYPTCDRRP